MSSRTIGKKTQMIVAGLAAVATISLVMYFASSSSSAKDSSKDGEKLDEDEVVGIEKGAGTTLSTRNTTSSPSVKGIIKPTSTSGADTPRKSNVTDEKELHSKIEELDKKGKALFKSKKYLEAATTFTEALDYIESHTDHNSNTSETSSLNKQIVTLINNRSAMYEKGNLPELAVEDCNKILQVYDITHSKARQRKLRILENKFHDYYQALVECCALQLQYMQQHRDQLRMGLPPSTAPPVEQSKLEELVQKLVPEQLDEYEKKVKVSQKDNPRLPSDYTLSQLLKSYTGFNAWMAKAARDGSVPSLKKQIDKLRNDMNDPAAISDVASLWMKIGRRHIYDGDYALARDAILKGYALVRDDTKVQSVMKDDDFARLLEWTGMVKHWAYELDAAIDCYRKCAELEPFNAEIMVKQAGVAMDAAKHEEAMALFDKALSVDPDAVDALLHRANLRMLQANLGAAKADLERCVKLRPDYVMALLRLAAVLTSNNDPEGAKKHLEAAARVDPDSSDVLSYQGELYFTQNDFVQAKEQFEKAMKLEPKNPTPYVNTALAVLNTPPEPGKQLEMAAEACSLLEKAIDVDPQFQTAYVQLGQLKLGMATDLDTAREVVDLYDKGLSVCRTKEEMKDLMGMKLLTQAQVDGATSMKMESFMTQ